MTEIAHMAQAPQLVPGILRDIATGGKGPHDLNSSAVHYSQGPKPFGVRDIVGDWSHSTNIFTVLTVKNI